MVKLDLGTAEISSLNIPHGSGFVKNFFQNSRSFLFWRDLSTGLSQIVERNAPGSGEPGASVDAIVLIPSSQYAELT